MVSVMGVTQFVSSLVLVAILLLVSSLVLAQSSVMINDEDGDPFELYGGSYALLVGVSKYTNGWNDLDQIPSELEDAEAALKLHGFEVTLETERTTASELPNVFQEFIFKHGYKQNNRLVIIYSGHGHTWVKGNQGYLVPSDAPRPATAEGNPGESFLRKALHISQMVEWSRQMTARHVLFLFDSCFSGTIFNTKGLSADSNLKSFSLESVARPVRQFITAGSANERVPAKSTFMPAFVDAITLGVGDLYKDGYITGTELGVFIENEVSQYTNQSPQFGKHPQRDLAKGNIVFVLSDNSNEVKSAKFSKKASIVFRSSEFLLEKCLEGVAESCLELGFRYDTGEGVRKDKSLAKEYYEIACSEESAVGCSNLGVWYSSGETVPVDYSKAASFYRKACNGDHSGSCIHLGFMFLKGVGVEENGPEALNYFRKACDLGNEVGCGHTAVQYQTGDGVMKDQSLATQYAQRGCEGGEAFSCFNLGTEYFSGKSGEKNLTKAAKYLQLGCEGGVMESCTNLGYMYGSGDGVQVDRIKAVRLFRHACEGGDPTGCYNLGVVYYTGDGVEEDKERALSLFKFACKNGHTPACESDLPAFNLKNR